MSNIDALTVVICGRTPASRARSVSSSRNRCLISTATISPLVARASSIVCAPGPHPTSRIFGCSGSPRAKSSARRVASEEPGPWRGRPSVSSRNRLIKPDTARPACANSNKLSESGALLVGGKTEPHVIGEPLAVRAAKFGAQRLANLGDESGALACFERRREGLRKGLEPSIYFGRQWGGARDECDVSDCESAAD